jgi:FAD dependent monooxygenase
MVVGVDELCYWMVGKHGRIYWCLVERLATKLHFPNLPKYTDAEAIAYAEERLNKILLSDTAQVTFGDLWENRQVYALVTVEEGNLGVWTAGNIVCIGDIVHKVKFLSL